ncbi:MAG: hypothetical protein F4Y02_08855 [Chloroflexi bacterium]|nr:hypothetical protein [Chloroflexota bacterium]
MQNIRSLRKRLVTSTRNFLHRLRARTAQKLISLLQHQPDRVSFHPTRILALVDATPPEWRFHALGIFALLGSLMVSWRSHDPTTALVAQWGLFVSFCLFAAGFVTWLVLALAGTWRTPVGKRAILLGHAAMLLVSVPPARMLVATSLELPPADFDFTVACCALLTYPAVGSLLVVAWVLIRYAIVRLATAISPQDRSLVERAVQLVLRCMFSRPMERARSRHPGEMASWALLPHLVGCLFLFVSVFVVVDNGLDSWIKPGVRNIAYWSDYHYLPKYPGVDPARRAKLHRNSFVSYATRGSAWDVDIVVERLRQ